MNKEIEDALCMLLHCSLKDTEFETQFEQYKIVRNYITNLQQENEDLKKQLEEVTEDYKRMLDNFNVKVDILQRVETQQQEFIKYLNDELKNLEHSRYVSFNRFGEYKLEFYKEILQKYREIIGSDNNGQ